jgi:hypothetical protein
MSDEFVLLAGQSFCLLLEVENHITMNEAKTYCIDGSNQCTKGCEVPLIGITLVHVQGRNIDLLLLNVNSLFLQHNHLSGPFSL